MSVVAGPAGSAVVSAPGARVPVPGWDRISAHALVRTAQAVASEALRTDAREVRARVSDDGHGALAVTVTAPLAVARLGTGSTRAAPITEAAHEARRTIAERVHRITGRVVARVDLEYVSSIIEQPRRVR